MTVLLSQRNVGILEKIVQSLTRASGGSFYDTKELNMQFKAQVDVISQLETKLLIQIQAAKDDGRHNKSTAVIKLSRDFERVQHQAVQYQEQVTRLHQQQAAVAAAAQDTGGSGDSSAAVQEDSYQQLQRQLEEDVSHIVFWVAIRSDYA